MKNIFKFKKDTKALMSLFGSMFLLEFGSNLLDTSYWIVGLGLGILGLPLFIYGIFSCIKEIKNTVIEIIEQRKK